MKGLTQEQLGQALGVEQGTISKIENEAVNVTLETLRAIARVLDVYVGELIEKLPLSDEAKLIAAAFDRLTAEQRVMVRALVDAATQPETASSSKV